MITQLEFNDLQKDELSKLISRVTISPYTDYKLFKQSITELLENGLVPTFFVQACERVRQERKDQGINAHLLKNVPLDTIIPEFDQSNPVNDKYAKKLTFVGEALLELFAQLTDSPLLAYRTRNNGDFFHDVYADKKYSNTQTQKTDGELYYHNDRTAHPVRADFLSLLGMRCSEENLIFTGYLDGKAILDNLKAESQEWLRKPLFITPFDEYSRDSNASQIDSELHPILENIHTFRYYDTRTTYSPDAPAEAIKALIDLKVAITKAAKGRVAINKGDLFSFANQDSLHNREIIQVRDPYSAEKRWLLKTYSFRNPEVMNMYHNYFDADLPGFVVAE